MSNSTFKFSTNGGTTPPADVTKREYANGMVKINTGTGYVSTEVANPVTLHPVLSWTLAGAGIALATWRTVKFGKTAPAFMFPEIYLPITIGKMGVEYFLGAKFGTKIISKYKQ
jgi:hypothetical protein